MDGLLVGLVPIRGRLVDYSWANIASRDLLVHRLLLDQLAPDTSLTVYPAFVVGVAQHDLFWKDIRRVLFSQAQYTVFCRIAVSGLANRWHPVKITGVLAGIIPQFDEMIRNFSDQAIVAMHGAGDIQETPIANDEQSWKGIMKEYTQQILTHHGRSLDSGVIDSMIDTISPEPNWLDSVDGRRSVFAKMTQCLDDALGYRFAGTSPTIPEKLLFRMPALRIGRFISPRREMDTVAPQFLANRKGSWTPKSLQSIGSSRR